MKTLKAFFQKLSAMVDALLSWDEYVDAGVIDFSGQGRDKYGR